MSNNVIRITDKLNVADSNVVASSKATSELKNSVDSLSTSKVSKSGDTITGNLVVDGDVTVVGKINATIDGSAENAMSAVKDSNGNVIVDTYATKSEVAVKDAEQDAAIEEALNRMSMPIGMVFPFTGKDVPAGTLRADGATYTNMKASFPDFYEWVKSSGLTVPLTDYALVEGSCGFYGLDESTGTVRMPTLAAGVFGADAASKYGQAVQAGLPNITGSMGSRWAYDWYYDPRGAISAIGGNHYTISTVSVYDASDPLATDAILVDASRSSPIYGKSNTVTPAHVKYPWVIVVYNAAIPASVTQAGEFVNLLDNKLGKSGDTATDISFPIGRIYSQSSDTIKEIVMSADNTGVTGGLISIRTAESVDTSGGVVLASRKMDGSWGAILTVNDNGRAYLNGKDLASASKPSRVKWADLSVPIASGTRFTAPANGIFTLSVVPSILGSWHLYTVSNTRHGFSESAQAGAWTEMDLSVQAGDVVEVVHGDSGASWNWFRFIYDVSEED